MLISTVIVCSVRKQEHKSQVRTLPTTAHTAALQLRLNSGSSGTKNLSTRGSTQSSTHNLLAVLTSILSFGYVVGSGSGVVVV